MIDQLDHEIHTALGAILDLAPEPTPTIQRTEPTTHRPVAVAAALIVAAAVATTAWLTTRTGPTAPSVSAATTVTPDSTSVATEPSTSTSATTGPTTAAVATTLPDLPIDPNELIAQTPQQSSTLAHGIDVAIRACMAKAGFDYHLQKVFVPPAVPRILDEAWRRQYGYGFPRNDTSDPAWDTWITTAQRDPAFMKALGPDGRSPGGGCTPSAYREIYTPNGVAVSPQNETFLKETAAFIIRTYGSKDQRFKTVLDPELEAARAAWSSCMTAAGIDGFYLPGQLASKYLSARPSQRYDRGVTQDEINAALQDWHCEVSTGFLQHWYGRLQTLTSAFATEHADLIAAIRQWNADATARAQQVIDANP